MDENTNNNSLVDELADGVVIDDPQEGNISYNGKRQIKTYQYQGLRCC